MKLRLIPSSTALAVAALLVQTTARAVIVGPYQTDSNTLHLWHLDEAAVPCIDSAAPTTGATNCVKLLNHATLGNSSYTGFGNALSSLYNGQNDITAADMGALLTPSAGTSPGNILYTYSDPASGAFTIEALVLVQFDPTANLAATTVGGNGRNSTCQILACESGTTAARIFQFRIVPKGLALVGTILATNGPVLTFENIRAGSSSQATIYAPIPMSGPDAIASNSWYHVAVTYNGVPNTANNIKFYWTLLDPSRTAATQIPITSAQATCSGPYPLGSTTCCPIIGNEDRHLSSNFLGLIDEVRVSKIERSAYGMMFAPANVTIGTSPASQFVAVGDTVALGVAAGGGGTLGYQWQWFNTNLPGATGSSLVLTNIGFNQTGNYRVIVTNVSSSATSAVATIRVGNLFNGLYATGLDQNGAPLIGGAIDPHYQLVYSDDPNYPGPATYVDSTPPAAWLADTASSLWISPGDSVNVLGGTFIYRTTFLLDTQDPANAQLTGNWVTDNQGLDIRLNGASTGQTTAGLLSTFVGFTLTNGFVPGINTLDFITTNLPGTGPNPGGVRAELRGVALPLQSTAVLLTAMPANVVTQAQQTASFSVVASGSGPLSYQWYFGPTLLSGETNRTLVLSGVNPASGGTYTVVVTNSVSATNASATLTVVTPPSLVWLGADPVDPTWWDTVTTNWIDTSTSANVAFGSYDDVLFDDRGSATPNVDLIQPLSPNSVTVNAATTAYTFSSLTTGTGAISGSVIFTKLGAATLILDETNNYTGPTLIQGGTLQVGNNDVNGSLGTGIVSNNAALVFDRLDTVVVPNTISGTGTVTMAGSGTLALSGQNYYTGPTFINAGIVNARTSTALGTNGSVTVANGGQLYIAGNINLAPLPVAINGAGNGYGALRKASGTATLFGGPITMTGDATIGVDASATFILTNGATVTGANANLDLWSDTGGSGTIATPISLGTGMVWKDGAGTWTLTATNNSLSGGITVNTGTLQIGDGGADGSWGTGPLTINGGTLLVNSALPLAITSPILDSGTLAIAGLGNVVISGEIDGAGGVTQSSGTSMLTSSNFYVGNGGTVTLTTSNTYIGTTAIKNAGVVRAAASSALGTGTITIGAAQTDTSRLELAGGIVLSNAITIFPRIFFGTASGTTDVAADILNVSGTNMLALPGNIIIPGGGNNLTLESDSGDLVLTAGVTAGGGGRHLVLRGAGNGEIQGPLNQSGANSEYVWKIDSGTWTLWGTNAPGAGTTISNGVLVLNGTLDTNLVTVAGGTLSGTGTLSGPVVVNAGAMLAPGPGFGVMAISNTLTFNNGSSASFSLNKAAAANSAVFGMTKVTYAGILSVTNLAGALAANDAFKLFDAASYAGGFAAISPASPGTGLAWNTNTLTADGTLRVASSVNLSRTNLNYSLVNGGTALQITWPADHTGWRLLSQTNSLNVGLSTNWVAMPGSAQTNLVVIPIGATNGAVFYLLTYP